MWNTRKARSSKIAAIRWNAGPHLLGRPFAFGGTMQRVMIVGQLGSGKSTLAQALGRRTGLPVFHMDHIHLQPGWVERPRAEKIELALAVEAQERWFFEGGLSST